MTCTSVRKNNILDAEVCDNKKCEQSQASIQKIARARAVNAVNLCSFLHAWWMAIIERKSRDTRT